MPGECRGHSGSGLLRNFPCLFKGVCLQLEGLQWAESGIQGCDNQEFRNIPTNNPRAIYAFNSCLSSFKKRQSVPSAMILLGLDLIRPTSWRRSA